MHFIERLLCYGVWLAWVGLLVQQEGWPSRGAAHYARQQRRGVPVLDA